MNETESNRPPQERTVDAAPGSISTGARAPAIPAASGNPFSTRHIRPGAVPYLFPPGQSLESLIACLESRGWWGEIIGPHGTGKSTLLTVLVAAIRQSGRRPLEIALHDGQRRLPIDLEHQDDLDATTLVVVDGYEQLSWWNRRRLTRLCRRRGCGLLVTAHKSVGLPQICATSANIELARRVVEQLLAGSAATISDEDLNRTWQRCGGNLREMLFELYDLYEQARRR